MAWNQDQVEKLKTLWKEGYSASQVAERLGQGVSRNAVIGKIHRLGLAERQRSQARAPRRSFARYGFAKPGRLDAGHLDAGRLEARGGAAARRMEAEALPPSGESEVDIFHLRDHLCRWPVHEIGDKETRFCGEKTASRDFPYCAYHARAAYQRRRARGTARARGRGHV